MVLADLEKYNQIVIQIHDNPDADAVGSGYAIYRYFQSRGKDVRLIYGGRSAMSKSNMLLFVKELDIPVEYVQELDAPELLITVDCQYGQGNVQHFEAHNVAMIDHHSTGRESDEMAEIRSHLVSCATVCYALLKDAGFDVNADRKIASALYYGLYMDSNQLNEINHPLDRDMIDFLQYNKDLITRLKFANLSIDDFETAGIAIIRHSYVEKNHFALITSKECDPNILGLIGDLALQVDCIDVCVVFCEYPDGYKLSVRSCTLEATANELAVFLTKGIGNGGGHLDKAGAFISKANFYREYQYTSIESYFFQKVDEYFNDFDVVRYSDEVKDRDELKFYQKKKGYYGYVKTIDLYEEGTECKIRALEGDVRIQCKDDVYIMIGYFGEAYPIEKSAFAKKYDTAEGKLDRKFEYSPIVINMENNEVLDLMPFAGICTSRPGACIYARRAKKRTKVFSRWDYETYMNCEKGDMICYSANDWQDVYVVRSDIFDVLYEEKK